MVGFWMREQDGGADNEAVDLEGKGIVAGGGDEGFPEFAHREEDGGEVAVFAAGPSWLEGKGASKGSICDSITTVILLE